MKLCEFGNNCTHCGTKAGLWKWLHETNRNTSLLKIRLATPQWKNLAGVRRLWESRVYETKHLIDFINFVRQPTEKCLRSGQIV